MKVVYDDGGRADAGFRGYAGDCVVRAIAIATQQPYRDVYDALSHGMGSQRGKHKYRNHRSARNGVTTKHKWFVDYMHSLGWHFTATMGIGTGCRVHLRDGELLMGRIIAVISKHYVAVIDGVIHDNHDCARGGTRCVYGYWS